MNNFFLSIVILGSCIAQAQVGIGTTTPNASAALDITSTTKGLLPPRMTAAQRDAIATPVQGLMVYCTNCGSNGEAQLYNGAAWVTLVGGTAAAATPDAPTVGTATGGDDQATVAFTAPTSDGGASITGYTVTSSPDGITATGTSSPITITGLTNGTAYTFIVTATNAAGTSAASTASNSVTPTPILAANEVYNPTTNKVWMDRNLGANQVSTSSTDAASYGDLYQWGRGTDGHEKRTSTTIATLSSSDTPGHGDFITKGNIPFDWRSPQNSNLWQGVNGTNNPCPSGYRLPTAAEWNAERLSWASNDSAGALASPLILPMPGFRISNGSPFSVGTSGVYYSSSVSDTGVRLLDFNSSGAEIMIGRRVNASAVRCLKD